MTSQPNISIPTTKLSADATPYTLYNISIQLPLRPVTISKRYSDFTTLHSALTSQASSTPPPAPLPGKSWFTRTTSSPALTEQRRHGLETYLQAINNAEDDRWRNTSAWRTFLNLPSSTNSSRSNLKSSVSNRGITTDPMLWLEQHKELKHQLHDARLALTRRDQAQAVQAQHEASAQAKKCLVRAGTMIAALDKGLEGMSGKTGKSALGEGEVRRRRDLVGMARKEREGLESLASAMASKAALDRSVMEQAAGKEEGKKGGGGGGGGGGDLFGAAKGRHGAAAATGGGGGGRVLGKETDKTRALDNQGVVQLQKQLMQEQDQDVEVLAQAVRRQKELGVQIQEELEVQKDLLTLVGEDVDRVEGKLGVARKRIGKIS